MPYTFMLVDLPGQFNYDQIMAEPGLAEVSATEAHSVPESRREAERQDIAKVASTLLRPPENPTKDQLNANPVMFAIASAYTYANVDRASLAANPDEFRFPDEATDPDAEKPVYVTVEGFNDGKPVRLVKIDADQPDDADTSDTLKCTYEIVDEDGTKKTEESNVSRQSIGEGYLVSKRDVIEDGFGGDGQENEKKVITAYLDLLDPNVTPGTATRPSIKAIHA